jgi:flagellar biosynthesis chaperone FliJ
MKKFSFRLDSLLHLREALEKMQGAVLGHADAAAGAHRVTAAASDEQLTTVEHQASDTGEARAAGMWHAMGLSVDAARVQAEHDAQALAAAETQHAQELERFAEARSARRVLERLRDKKVADWTVAVGREERLESEEIVRQRLNRGDAR